VEVPVSLTVEPCQPVEIQFIGSSSPVKVGETMYFTATVTGSDPSYAWDFGGAGSGTGLTTANPTWTYAEAGDYLVTLTVTNLCGSDDDTLPVQVEERKIYLPLVSRNHTE
jgi:PKD repeat protein